MRNLNRRLSLNRPTTYQIKVQGRLSEGWSDQFAGMTITVESVADGLAITTLSGAVADQAALHGVLGRIRDLGLPLLLVQHLENE